MKKLKSRNSEVWMEIDDFEDYLVSNYGRVKSMKWGKEKILKNFVSNTGYPSVGLRNQNEQKFFRVHRLVARCFIGLCPKGKEVNHKDGNKENPNVKNLEYVTRSKNVKHAYKIGLKNAVGSKNGRALINENIVKKIRRKWRTDKYTYFDLEAKFGVSYDNIRNIITRRSWKHI